MGKSSGPEAAVVVVSLRNFFFFFFFRSFHHLVRACKPFYFTSFGVPLFIQFSSDFSSFFLSASQRFHSNDAQWIAHLSTKSDGAIEKEKGGKNPPTLFSSFF
jgi:hypothetical protein